MQPKLRFLSCFLLSFFALCLSSGSIAQTPPQKQTLTALTKRLISVYNSNDTSQYKTFAATWAKDKSRITAFVQQFGREQADLGAVRVRRIRIVSPTETEALVQSLKYEAWWRVVVITDSLQRFKEHHMGLVRVTDEVLDSGLLTGGQISSNIDNYLKRQTKFDSFKGNVYVEKNGKAIYAKSFGLNADGKPNTFRQQFGLASVGKLFTAIGILQLVDGGKLSLDNKIGTLLPGLRNKKLSAITLHQLLTHTSGMGDFFEDPDFQKIMDSAKSSLTQVVNLQLSEAEAFLPFIEKDSLRFSPGTDWAYSNTGFELLGMVLEKTAGLSYKEYVSNFVFKPAGMTASVVGSGSGGGLSTVSDLDKFSQALRNNLLLSPPLTTKFLSFTQNGFYGYGSEHQMLGGEHITGHSGGFENVCNELNIYQHLGYTVVILSNGNPPFGHFLSDKIKQLLVRKGK